MSSYSKKILKKLSEKPAIPVENFKEGSSKSSYAVTRALTNLVGAGYAEMHDSGRGDFVRITKKGKIKFDKLSLEGEDALVPATWDGLWRIVILDIPEERKSERESLRYLLKKAGFACIKNTVWISPLPYEQLFINLKKDLNFSTELMIIVTDKLDEETNRAFFQALKN